MGLANIWVLDTTVLDCDENDLERGLLSSNGDLMHLFSLLVDMSLVAKSLLAVIGFSTVRRPRLTCPLLTWLERMWLYSFLSLFISSRNCVFL